jgi:hypothetical protein
VPADVRALIRMMAQANARCGAPRIHGELLKLGIDVYQSAVAKSLVRRRRPSSRTRRTFLRNHIAECGGPFLRGPDATYPLLFVLVVLATIDAATGVAVAAHPTKARLNNYARPLRGISASVPDPRSRSLVRPPPSHREGARD